MPVANLVLAIVFGLLAGAALAAAACAPGSRKAFERDKAEFGWEVRSAQAARGTTRLYLVVLCQRRLFAASCLTPFMLYFRYYAPPL